METTLILLLASALVSGATQLIKHFVPVNSLFVVAALSAIGGIGYASLVQVGYWEVVREFSTVAFTGAVTIHQVLKQITE